MIDSHNRSDSSLAASTQDEMSAPVDSTKPNPPEVCLGSEPERGERTAGEDALVAWRGKAADLLLVASVAAQLPVFVLIVLGFGPQLGLLLKAVGLTVYAVFVCAALLRGVGYRTRLLAFIFVAFMGVAVVNIALPHGPFAQVGLVTLPILVLVLVGPRAAKIAILVCTVILVAAPWLRLHPDVVRTLAIDPAQRSDPWSLVWMHVTAQVAFLLALMVLLERFYQFLLDTLAAESQAKKILERKAVEQSAIQQKMENEIRERRRLEREIANIGDRERRRLGHDLHDGVCQQVTAALLRCQALERCVERGGAFTGADFTPLSSLLAETLNEAHNVALGLCPLDADCEALVPALRALAQRIREIAAIHCEFLFSGKVCISDHTVAQHLYRIAQEALSNATRHAQASRIAIELRGDEYELFLRVEDNGTGLPVVVSGSGMGLRTMTYRAQLLEGELTIAPAPGGGTSIICRVPRSLGIQTVQ